MIVAFFVAAAVAVAATLFAITRLNAVHALLNLIVGILALAVIFYLLGAPFAAALEVIIYAGAIVVLLLFVVMMLNLGRQSVDQERSLMRLRVWVVPVLLAIVLLVELITLVSGRSATTQAAIVQPAEVGSTLFGPYLIGVEIASFLLIAGIIGAFHLGRRIGASAKEAARTRGAGEDETARALGVEDTGSKGGGE